VLTVDGTLLDGDISLDNGLVVRGSPATVKLSVSSVLRARFSAPQADEFQPGLVLTGGGRIAGTFSSLSEPVVNSNHKPIAIPGKEVAWVVYPAVRRAACRSIPHGKMGALLPAAIFSRHATRGNSNTAKVLNPIFGPRTFNAQKKEIRALILREIQPQPPRSTCSRAMAASIRRSP